MRKKSLGVIRLPGWVFIAIFSLLSLSGVRSQTFTGSVNTGTTYQTLEGFGAAVAWYHNWLTEHPHKIELYDVLFRELGLDILRIRNQYRNNPDFDFESTEIVKMASLSLGYPIKVLISSWTPPANLKVNGVLNGGTLIQENGAYVYGKFADYWYNALLAYKAKGIVPEYISIQNEPDYQNTGWETCIFKPTEGGGYPGYGKALDAVYNKIKSMSPLPKILGGEATGLGTNLVQNYTNNLNQAQIYGIAHHLYNGGDPNNPDSYITNMKSVAAAFPDKPLFQTEYDQGTAFTTALLMHNSLVEEGVSGYFFWDLIWENKQRPLVFLESPWKPETWTNPKGYIISDFYHIFKHYAKFIDSGYKRVAATSTSGDIRMSAFISPDKNQLTIVLINKASSQYSLALNLNGYSVGKSVVYRTAGSEKFKSLGSLPVGNTVVLPAQAVVTVVINSPGYVPTPTPPPLPTPTPPTTARNAFSLIEAESYNAQFGIQTSLLDDNGGRYVGYIENGDYAGYSNVDFGSGATGFEVRVASNTTGGKVELRLDNPYGPTVASCTVGGTGGWTVWSTVTGAISGVTGSHYLYMSFTGGSGYLLNIDSIKFTGGIGPTPTPGANGDVNRDGKVDIIDALLVAQYSAGLNPANCDVTKADVNGDGKVDILDALLIARRSAGL